VPPHCCPSYGRMKVVNPGGATGAFSSLNHSTWNMSL
jgi:hypothetical protein